MYYQQSLIMQADLLLSCRLTCSSSKRRKTSQKLLLKHWTLVRMCLCGMYSLLSTCMVFWCNVFHDFKSLHSVYLENAKLQMDLVKVEEVSSITLPYNSLPCTAMALSHLRLVSRLSPLSYSAIAIHYSMPYLLLYIQHHNHHHHSQSTNIYLLICQVIFILPTAGGQDHQ